jgi:hypothetical protein
MSCFHPRLSSEISAEGPVTMTWEIEAFDCGTSKLTVTTSGIVAGGQIEREFIGGTVYIVSGLKTYLETGEPMVAAAAAG